MLDNQNLKALAEKGAECVLMEFVNLAVHQDLAKRAERFRKSYGELYPGLPLASYGGYAEIFRQAWRAKTPEEIKSVGSQLGTLLERAWMLLLLLKRDGSNLPRGGLLAVDFSKGTIDFKQQTLLGVLTVKLIENREKLAVCEQGKDCPTPFYIKEHSRQVFCSTVCADSVRGRKKKAWQQAHRSEIIENKRKKRLAARKHSRRQVSRVTRKNRSPKRRQRAVPR
jgi:hypothetical protein